MADVLPNKPVAALRPACHFHATELPAVLSENLPTLCLHVNCAMLCGMRHTDVANNDNATL